MKTQRALTDSAADQRGDDRALLLYRVATVATPRRQGLAVVRNISASGLMAQTSVELSPGEHVTLELASQLPLDGTVVWRRDKAFGMQFDERVQLSDVLAKTAGRKGSRRRMPRLVVSAPVSICDNGRIRRATILDISVTGFRFRCDSAVELGPIALEHPDLGRHPARALWTEDHVYGGLFNEPLPWNRLVEWSDHVTGIALH